MHLNIFVSQQCFLYCKGCYSFSREEKCNTCVSSDDLINFLDFAYKKGIKKVTLCGGDPLTRADIIDLLERIKKIGFSISMDTLGTSLIKDIKQNGKIIIKKTDVQKIATLVDMIGIPIDGSNNEIFKKFRQTESDIINEQLSICAELHKHGANICINTVVHKGNLKDAENLSKLINKMNYIKKWQMFKFAPLGKFGSMNRNLFEINDQEFIDFKNNVIKKYSGDSNMLDFKNSERRNKTYVLINNSGDAWIPFFEDGISDNCLYNQEESKMIGNITNKKNWEKICSYFI